MAGNKIHRGTIVNKILMLLLTVTIVPLMLVMLIACGIWSNTIISRTDELMESRMSTTQQGLDDYFTKYDRIIMEIYTANQFSSYLKKLNSFDRQDYFLAKNKIDIYFQDLEYMYPDMLGIGLYTKKNELIFCDSETGMSTESFFFPEDVSEWQNAAKETFDYTGNVYSETVELEDGNGEKQRVMYLAHRITDMNNYSRGTQGSIVICLDEAGIRQIYSPVETSDSQVSFLCDQKGTIVSCSNPEFIGVSVWNGEEERTEEQLQTLVKDAVTDHHMIDSSRALVYMREVCNSSFFQFSIQDQDALLKNLHYVVAIVVLIGIITILVSAMVAFGFAEKIETIIQKIISAMNEAYDGNYQVQIDSEGEYEEFAKISRHFNHMVKQIEISGRQEKEALIREKNAEIVALEAQINPHFLYNTLDAINWMAIENEQFQISRMLKDLAIILRYSIQNSNSTVTLEDEIEYLKKYILLQQQRFEFSFKCLLDIEEELLKCQMHKLLFQPLIENAIIHGFPGNTGEDTIWIQAARHGEESLVICVKDNGRGMKPEIVEELNHFDYRNHSVESSIGIRNVFMRVKYYYGEQGDFKILSDENGTTVTLKIKYEE